MEATARTAPTKQPYSLCLERRAMVIAPPQVQSQSQSPRRWHHRKRCGGGGGGGWMTTLPKLTVALFVVFGPLRHNPVAAAFQSLSSSYPSSPLAFQRSTRAASRAARRANIVAFAKTITTMASKKGKNDDDDELLGKNPGMDEAFRQLESLRSLDDPEEYIPAPEKIKLDKQALADTSGLRGASNTTAGDGTSTMEQDFEVYKNMAAELERNDDDAAYAELLKMMGGSALQMDDIYTQVLNDLGGSLSTSSSSGGDNSAAATSPTSTPSTDEFIEQALQEALKEVKVNNPSTASMDEFIEQALQEALKEVKVNNPKLSNNILNDKEIMAEIEDIMNNKEMMAEIEGIMNDKEIMAEIEDIFERNTGELMASLEEFRKEQLAEAVSSASRSANAKTQSESDAANRYQRAEQSMQTMLQKVNSETANVERAVADLQAANAAVDQDVLYQLKRGGWPKQISLVGLVLFAVRSILDSVAGIANGDESYLVAALVQGAIALICGLVFVVLK